MDEKNAEQQLYSKYLTTAAQVSTQVEQSLLESERYLKYHYDKYLPKDKTKNILEIGCGHGRFIRALNNCGYSNVIGIDFSEEQVVFANNNLNIKNVIQADAIQWLDTENKKFDCILMLDVLEHLTNSQILDIGKKVFDALSDDGCFITQIPSGTSPMNPIIYGDLTHRRAFTPRSMQQLFLNLGFATYSFSAIKPGFYKPLNFFRRIILATVMPFIWALGIIMHGGVAKDSIYTSNFIAVAYK